MEGAASNEPSVATRAKTWFEGVPFATRAVFVVCVGLYAFQLLFDLIPTVRVCMIASAVVEQYQIHRLFTSALFHVGAVHVAFNMLAFVPTGRRLERQMGTVKFVYLIGMIMIMAEVLYILMAYLCATGADLGYLVHQCAIGSSGVIFGLIVVHANTSNVEHYSILGLFPVPAKLYPWALLIFWQFLIPGISFLGHLSGLLIGQMYVWKVFSSVMPSDATVNKIERSLCSVCVEWPNFILTSNTSTSLPTHATPSEGSSSSWRTFHRALSPQQEPVPFQGSGQTTGSNTASDSRFPGQPHFINASMPSTSQTSTIPVIEEPQDDFQRLCEMGFDGPSDEGRVSYNAPWDFASCVLEAPLRAFFALWGAIHFDLPISAAYKTATARNGLCFVRFWRLSASRGLQCRVFCLNNFSRGLELGCDIASKDIPPGLELATFAGGTFWGLQLVFERVHGVVSTQVGYTDGRVPFPFYSIVLSDTTGHALAIQVLFDPEQVCYGELIDELLRHIDPTTLNRQRDDVGTLYRSAIYYHSDQQKTIAEERMKQLRADITEGQFRETDGKEVVVELKEAVEFYVGEEIHQGYLEKGGRSGNKQSVQKGCQDPIEWLL